MEHTFQPWLNCLKKNMRLSNLIIQPHNANTLLKNNKWELKNNTFMFYEDAALKEFNAVYQEMVQLNTQMQEITQQHQRALESKL